MVAVRLYGEICILTAILNSHEGSSFTSKTINIGIAYDFFKLTAAENCCLPPMKIPIKHLNNIIIIFYR